MIRNRLLISADALVPFPLNTVHISPAMPGIKEVIPEFKKRFAADIFLGWAEEWGGGIIGSDLIEWLKIQRFLQQTSADLDLCPCDQIFVLPTAERLFQILAKDKLTHIVAKDSDAWEPFLSVNPQAHLIHFLGEHSWARILQELPPIPPPNPRSS